MSRLKTFIFSVCISIFCMQAHAQVNLTVRSVGIVNSGGPIPGVGSVASGEAYTMEVSSVFPATDQGWISWPNAYNAGNVPFTVLLTVGGTTHEISATGQLNMGMGDSVQGGVTYRLMNYSLSMRLPDEQGLLNFTTIFYLETQDEPYTLIDLFDPSRGLAVAPDADHVNLVRLYGPGNAGTGITGFATSVSYSTIGSPVAIIPEPSSAAMWLAGLSLTGMAIAARRRRYHSGSGEEGPAGHRDVVA